MLLSAGFVIVSALPDEHQMGNSHVDFTDMYAENSGESSTIPAGRGHGEGSLLLAA